MYVSAVATGSQAATVTTEHTLNSPAVAGRFVLIVDTSVMQAGDVLELRTKQVVLTGGTLRVVSFAAFYGVQSADDTMKTLEAVDNELVEASAVSFTLKQTFGTSRTYPWKVLNLATTPANISALSIDGNGRVDVIKVAGTTQTARDLGVLPNDTADALLDRTNAIETGLTVRGALRLALAALAGKASGLAGTTAVYRNAVADSKDRLTATVDSDGNRSSVTSDIT